MCMLLIIELKCMWEAKIDKTKDRIENEQS